MLEPPEGKLFPDAGQRKCCRLSTFQNCQCRLWRRKATGSDRRQHAFKRESQAIRPDPKKPAQPPDPGVILEAIENEEVIVLDNGKHKPMKKAEIRFRLLCKKAINGDLKTARILVHMAFGYLRRCGAL